MPGNQHYSWLSATSRLQFPEISHYAPPEFLWGAVQVSLLETSSEGKWCLWGTQWFLGRFVWAWCHGHVCGTAGWVLDLNHTWKWEGSGLWAGVFLRSWLFTDLYSVMRNALFLIQKKKRKKREERRSKTVEALMTRSNLYKSSLFWERKTEQAGNENIVDNFTSFTVSAPAFSLLAKTCLVHQRNPCKSCSLRLDGCRKGGLIGGKKTNTVKRVSEWLSLCITYTL